MHGALFSFLSACFCSRARARAHAPCLFACLFAFFMLCLLCLLFFFFAGAMRGDLSVIARSGPRAPLTCAPPPSPPTTATTATILLACFDKRVMFFAARSRRRRRCQTATLPECEREGVLAARCKGCACAPRTRSVDAASHRWMLPFARAAARAARAARGRAASTHKQNDAFHLHIPEQNPRAFEAPASTTKRRSFM